MLIRIISGVVGIGAAAFIIQTGGALFAAAVTALMMVGWHEYAKAFAHGGVPLAYGSGMAAMAFLGAAAFLGGAPAVMAVTGLSFLAMMAQAVFCHRSFSLPQAMTSAAGIVYVGFTLSHLILLRFWQTAAPLATPVGLMDAGCAWLWIALIGTWASDTFAYFTGYALGRHKLCEAISPKKTLEGFGGGVIGTAAAVAALGSALQLPLALMAGLGIAIALTATVGDLVESALKRHVGVKDSGALIPGHGGVLDRFDSVMFVVPCVYYFVYFFSC